MSFFVHLVLLWFSSVLHQEEHWVGYAGTLGFLGLTWTLTGSGMFQQSRAMVPCGAKVPQERSLPWVKVREREELPAAVGKALRGTEGPRDPVQHSSYIIVQS